VYKSPSQTSLSEWNEYKIEICIALKAYQCSDADMLQFKKGEKILIDRSVKGHGSHMVFGRIGQREGFFPLDSSLVKLEEYVI